MVLGATEAEQVGLNYRTGRPVQIATANGVTQAWSLKIGTIRLGDVRQVTGAQNLFGVPPIPL